MSDPFDTDPDEFLDSEADAGRQYEKGNFDVDPKTPTAPEPEIPSPQDNYDDVDSDLRTSFWALVLVFNVSLFAMSLGVMLVVFDENRQLGAQLFLAGLVVTLYGLYRYRKTKRRIDRGEYDQSTEDESDGKAGSEQPGKTGSDQPADSAHPTSSAQPADGDENADTAGDKNTDTGEDKNADIDEDQHVDEDG